MREIFEKVKGEQIRAYKEYKQRQLAKIRMQNLKLRLLFNSLFQKK